MPDAYLLLGVIALIYLVSALLFASNLIFRLVACWRQGRRQRKPRGVVRMKTGE
jgi:hypothetical protein